LQLSIQDNKYVFMEVRDELGKWPSIISKHKIVKMPKQLFAQKPKRSDIQNLMNIWDDRTQEFSSDGKKVHITFIICGEINGFNPDGNLKFGYSFQRTNLVNPCHTIMGRWYVLNRKLENLSIGHKMIYVSNNDRSSPKITTSLRIYDNGHQVEVRRQVPGLMWAQIEI
jgi:small-conductance mechanosensitive channel